MSRPPVPVDPWQQWAQNQSDPPADWPTVFAVTAAVHELLQTLDGLLAGIGAAGPIEVQDDTFLLRGQLELAGHICDLLSAGLHRNDRSSAPRPAGQPVTVLCDIDDDPPALLVVLTLRPGQDPYFEVDTRLTDASIDGVTPVLAFTGDITSLVTPGSQLRVLRIPA